MKGVCFLGGYVKGYPRSAVLRRGLEKRGLMVRSCHVSHKRRLPSRYAVLFFRYMFSKKDFSVIYVPEFRHKDVPIAWLLGKLTRKPVIFDPLVSRYDTRVRDRADAREQSLQAWHNKNIDRFSLALPAIVLADTKSHANYFISELGAAPDKVRVLPVGFDEELFKGPGPDNTHRDGSRTNGKRTKVLFFGNYIPLHGVETIVEAAKILRSREEIEFELIGGGQTYPEIETCVAKEQLKNIRLMSRLPIELLPARIASASICLGIFGRTEKALRVVPNKVYQCMAMGKAVITARSEAILEHFSDGDNICLVPPGDAKALAEKIVFLASRPDERERIGARAFQLLSTDYHSGRIAELFLTYCSEILT